MKVFSRTRWLGLCLAASLAHAAPTAQEAAQAKELFARGKKLLEERRFDEACSVLAQSQQLDPGTGTLLALALCHEGQGRTTTAWSEFKDVVSFSRRDKRPDREALASERIAALEKRLSRLEVRVNDEAQALDGFDLRLDGRALPPALWGSPFPVDPGPHELKASAPGRSSFAARVTVGAERDLQRVSVPMLPREGAAEGAPPQEPRDRRPERKEEPSRAFSYALGGLGVVALGVGGVFGLNAISKQSDAEKLCPQSPCGSVEGLNLNREALQSATISTVSFGVSVAAFAAAALLWPSYGVGSARVSPWLVPGSGGAALRVVY